jgi:hypothetical protein
MVTFSIFFSRFSADYMIIIGQCSTIANKSIGGISMEQDLKKAGVKRCYACIQWEGQRTYYSDKKMFKVDTHRDGNCLVRHQLTKGSHFCDRFEALK